MAGALWGLGTDPLEFPIALQTLTAPPGCRRAPRPLPLTCPGSLTSVRPPAHPPPNPLWPSLTHFRLGSQLFTAMYWLAPLAHVLPLAVLTPDAISRVGMQMRPDTSSTEALR